MAVILISVVWFGRVEERPSQRIAGTGRTVTSDDTSQPAGSNAATTPAYTARFATARDRNHDGRYSFRYPVRWRVTKIGAVTQVKSPGAGTIVNLGRATSQSPRRITASLFRATEGLGYRKVARIGTRVQSFGGGRAHMLAARAINADGVRLRVLFVAVDRGAKSFPVTIFTGRWTDPTRVLPRVEAIVASLTPLRRN